MVKCKVNNEKKKKKNHLSCMNTHLFFQTFTINSSREQARFMHGLAGIETLILGSRVSTDIFMLQSSYVSESEPKGFNWEWRWTQGF